MRRGVFTELSISVRAISGALAFFEFIYNDAGSSMRYTRFVHGCSLAGQVMFGVRRAHDAGGC
jgi:hypothetical protein